MKFLFYCYKFCVDLVVVITKILIKYYLIDVHYFEKAYPKVSLNCFMIIICFYKGVLIEKLPPPLSSCNSFSEYLKTISC